MLIPMHTNFRRGATVSRVLERWRLTLHIIIHCMFNMFMSLVWFVLFFIYLQRDWLIFCAKFRVLSSFLYRFLRWILIVWICQIFQCSIACCSDWQFVSQQCSCSMLFLISTHLWIGKLSHYPRSTQPSILPGRYIKYWLAWQWWCHS